MSRVTGDRRTWQLSALCVMGLATAIVLGCAPQPSERTTEKKTKTGVEKTAVEKTTAANTGEKTVEPKKTEATSEEKKTTERAPEEKKTTEKVPEDKPAEKPVEKPSEKPVVALAFPDFAELKGLPANKRKERIRDLTMAAATPLWLPKVPEPGPPRIPEAEAAAEPDMKAYTEKVPGTEAQFQMVPIRGGKFMMGSPKDERGHKPDEAPQHEVKIDPFWMGANEVTWDEFELWGLGLDKLRREQRKIESTDRDIFTDAIAEPTKPYADMTFGMGREGCPAICMTQFAAKMYCKWLTAKTGHYYRLPTEAEWEYACRAGTTTAYSFGDDAKKLSDYAWYTDNSDDKYHKVGKKKPNPWGLFDIYGNVAEWVLDQVSAEGYKKFEGQTADNPLMAPTKEWGRVVRGGSWDDDAEKCRAAARRGSVKDWKKQDPQIPQSIWYLTDGNFIGCRVVRPLKVPTPEEAAKYEVDEEQLEKFKEYLEAQAGKE